MKTKALLFLTPLFFLVLHFANFVQAEGEFILTPVATNGTIVITPDQATYEQNENVTLKAVPDEGYLFEGWEGACSGIDSNCSITMDSDKTVTAIFSAELFSMDWYQITTDHDEVSSLDRQWSSITSSSDGQYLAATVYGGYIYTSSDYGQSWTERTDAGLRDWWSITSSSDGQSLVAVATTWEGNDGYIYTSSDGGDSWEERASAGSREWYYVTSSSDGQYLAATAYGGYIHTSSNYGVDWTEQASSTIQNWTSIDSDSTGQYLVAGAHNGYLYTSSDYGQNWTERTSAGSGDWLSVTSSSNGQYLAGIRGGNLIYTSSNYGADWTRKDPIGTHRWYAITSSSDGQKLAIISTGINNTEDGYISILDNYEGSAWSVQNSIQIADWSSGLVSIAASDSFSHIVAPIFTGGIYFLYNDIVFNPPTPQPSEPEPEPEPTPSSRSSSRSGSRKKIPTPTTSTVQEPLSDTPVEPQTLSNNPFIRDLREGIRGEDVRQLQILLNKKGYMVNTAPLPGSPGFETPYFGNRTRNMLIKYQQDNNISPTHGYFGPLTRAQILK